ncbi:uncharacterized protein LOC107263819 [Cephus cinctus]|uniref:Uncharacterized protein LOC107263819 n=1 Tax=Cephus cinctus TaxID=211228 RepID=A0AAJ7BIJ8_CEPCN|nr:uncharacterized protein LOC107263819 [Cephus cinctus]
MQKGHSAAHVNSSGYLKTACFSEATITQLYNVDCEQELSRLSGVLSASGPPFLSPGSCLLSRAQVPLTSRDHNNAHQTSMKRSRQKGHSSENQFESFYDKTI